MRYGAISARQGGGRLALPALRRDYPASRAHCAPERGEMTERHLQPLDFVRTPKGAIAIVSETNGRDSVAITFVGKRTTDEKNAWWNERELKLIDALPYLLSRMTAHPMGDGRRGAHYHFGAGFPEPF